MAKFIIEVDDDYIRENAKLETLKGKIDSAGSNTAMAKVIFDMAAFAAIAKRIGEGETEFRITRDMMADDTTREYWERNVPDILMLANMAFSGKKKEEDIA